MAAGGEAPAGLVQNHYQTLVEHCQVFINALLSADQRLPGTLRENLDQARMAFQRRRDTDFQLRVSLPYCGKELRQVLLNVKSEGQEIGNYYDLPDPLADQS